MRWLGWMPHFSWGFEQSTRSIFEHLVPTLLRGNEVQFLKYFALIWCCLITRVACKIPPFIMLKNMSCGAGVESIWSSSL